MSQEKETPKENREYSRPLLALFAAMAKFLHEHNVSRPWELKLPGAVLDKIKKETELPRIFAGINVIFDRPMIASGARGQIMGFDLYEIEIEKPDPPASPAAGLWQPIETARKDGKDFLVYVSFTLGSLPHFMTFVCHWAQQRSGWHFHAEPTFLLDHYSNIKMLACAEIVPPTAEQIKEWTPEINQTDSEAPEQLSGQKTASDQLKIAQNRLANSIYNVKIATDKRDMDSVIRWANWAAQFQNEIVYLEKERAE